MQVKSIRHSGIVVSDLEKALDLYSNIFGMEIVKIEDLKGKYINHLLGFSSLTYVKLRVNNGDLIELYYFSEMVDKSITPSCNPHRGYNHIAFTVDNIQEVYKNLLKTDYKYITKPIVDPSKEHKVMFYRDFDQNLFELVEEL